MDTLLMSAWPAYLQTDGIIDKPVSCAQFPFNVTPLNGRKATVEQPFVLYVGQS